MKTALAACMVLLAATVAWSNREVTNAFALTDAEVRMVEHARARKAKAAEAAKVAAARNRAEAIALKAPGMTRNALNDARLGPHVGARAVAASARQMVPKTVYGRKRIVGMDSESVPGSVVYTYAQGGHVWYETNALKAVEFKVARNRYSKLRIVVTAKAAGKWDALKAGIAAADLADEWNACQYIEDGDPSFVAATNAVDAAGVATAEEIAAFLEQAIDN